VNGKVLENVELGKRSFLHEYDQIAFIKNF